MSSASDALFPGKHFISTVLEALDTKTRMTGALAQRYLMRAAMAGEVQLLDEPLAYWCKRPDATGSAANSVSHEQQHRIFDAQVRANAIREDLAAGAHIGPYLYQAHLTNELDGRLLETLEALQDVQERLERLETMQQEQCERLHRMERAMSWSGKLSRLRAVFSPKDSSSK